MALENETTNTAETPEDTNKEEKVINLVIEDGSCISSANSYVSLDYAETYQSDRGRDDWINLAENEKKASLIKATQYVDSLFNWKGRRKFETQELNFPRVMIKDLDGFDVNGIPKKLKDAVCEAAFYGYQSELFTTHKSETGNIKRELKEVSNAVKTEIEYFGTEESSVDYISKYAALDLILKGLYYEKGRKTVNSTALWGY